MTDIRGFHAHVYFDTVTRGTAEQVYAALARVFDVKLGSLHGQPVGPHPKPMFQVTLAPEQFATVVPWLMVHRSGLSVLVHPTTDDAVADHDTLLCGWARPCPSTWISSGITPARKPKP